MKKIKTGTCRRASVSERRFAEARFPSGKVFILFAMLITLSSLLVSSCSSAPKKPAEIFTERIVAANQLNLANQIANQGRYEDALLILTEARRLALSTDDPQLRIKTSMSRGNILFALGRQTEAFREWDTASAEGETSGEKVLAAFARIYKIRAELVLLANNENTFNAATAATAASATAAAAEEFKQRLSDEMTAVKSNSPATAAAYVTLGLAEKQLKRFTEAETAVKKALDIHEKSLSLEDAAYDWYIIASIRSVAGDYPASLDALNNAIKFDRRAENGFGLASSWKAMGEVYQKTGKTEEARLAFERAADIYRAIGLNEQ
jgi:tetratricopeptide (TPR) repeat protein